MKCVINVAVVSVLVTVLCLASACDDARWREIEAQYDACVEETTKELDRLSGEQLLERQEAVSLEKCRTMDRLLECSALLTECMTSHFAESEQKLFSLPMDPSASNSVQECQLLLLKDEEEKHSISKRSPGKSSSNSGSGSRVSQVKSAVSSVLGGGSHHGKSSAGGFAGAVGGAGLASKVAGGSSGSSKILKRVGKYAVAGVAVYGTFKLAKSMSKGLRDLYDVDDCWDYRYLEGQYRCVCQNQCQIYVSAASVQGLTSGLLVLSTAVSLYNNYFRN